MDALEGTVAVFVVFFEIVHVLEVFLLVCDAADVLTAARVADALIPDVARASFIGDSVLLLRAHAIVGHGLSFSEKCDQLDRSKRGATCGL
jgi:hypothetical protein